VGDGTRALSSGATPVFLDEYTPAGTRVRTLPMPTSADASAHRLVAAGTSSAEGLLTRSVEARYLVLTGYDAAIGTAGLSGTTASSTLRTIGRVDANGAVDTMTFLDAASISASPRGIASVDGSAFWFTARRAVFNSSPSGRRLPRSSARRSANLRQVNIFGSQLFISDASGTAVRLGSVGTGTPMSAGETMTNLPGFPTAGSPYAFFFADLDPAVAGLDVLYVASDDVAALTKYSLVSGAWAANGTVSDAYRGLTGFVNGTSVVLYATRKGGTNGAGGGELVALVDDGGYNASFTASPVLLATAQANTAFRGVAVATTP
jgi:hypothetical protein